MPRIPTCAKARAMTEGEFATRLGLPAAPAMAEAMIVERDIRLVELTGARYHFGQISTRASLEAIAAAKARGLAHHLRRLRPSSDAERAGCRPLLHLPQGEAAAAHAKPTAPPWWKAWPPA